MLSTSESLKLKKYIEYYLDIVLSPSNIQAINEYLLNGNEKSLLGNYEGYSLAITKDKLLISISCEQISKLMKGNLQLDNVIQGVMSYLNPTFTELNLAPLTGKEFSLRAGIGIYDSPEEWSDKIIAVEVDMDLDRAIELSKAVLIFGLIAEALIFKALIVGEEKVPSFHYEAIGLKS